MAFPFLSIFGSLASFYKKGAKHYEKSGGSCTQEELAAFLYEEMKDWKPKAAGKVFDDDDMRREAASLMARIIVFVES